MPQVDQLINGTLISPGTTYYVKYRYRDIHGNLSLPSAATSIIARYTNRQPAARVYRDQEAVTGGTLVFKGGQWSAYPGQVVNSNFSFDNFSNFNAGIVSGTAPLLRGTPSSSTYFRAPCNGSMFVEARLALAFDGSYSGAAQTKLDCGIFRLGSQLPGGTATEPVVTYNFGVLEQAAPLTAATTTYIPAASGAISIVKFAGTVSVASGDYVCVGVYPEQDGLCAPPIPNPESLSSRNAGYMYFGMHQD